MLHSIDEQGNFQWHCANPTCQYHNCAEWEAHQSCQHHGRGERVAGKSLQGHIGHDEVQYTSENTIALPTCQCGTRCFVYAGYTEKDVQEAVVSRHPQTGKILSVEVKGAPGLTLIHSHLEYHLVPLSSSDIARVPVDALVLQDGHYFLKIAEHVIDAVQAHPVPQRHLALAQQMKAMGKIPPEL